MNEIFKTVPVDLSELINVVKLMLFTTDTKVPSSGLVSKTQFNSD